MHISQLDIIQIIDWIRLSLSAAAECIHSTHTSLPSSQQPVSIKWEKNSGERERERWDSCNIQLFITDRRAAAAARVIATHRVNSPVGVLYDLENKKYHIRVTLYTSLFSRSRLELILSELDISVERVVLLNASGNQLNHTVRVWLCVVVLCCDPGCLPGVMRSAPEVQHPITRLPLSNLIDPILHVLFCPSVRPSVCLSPIFLFSLFGSIV